MMGFLMALLLREGSKKNSLELIQMDLFLKKPHPKSLGSALKNKFITTDFSEAQIELVTPVFED